MTHNQWLESTLGRHPLRHFPSPQRTITFRKPRFTLRVLNAGVLYLTLSARYRGKWTIRYMITRKAREIGIGPYLEFSLADTLKKHFDDDEDDLTEADPQWV